MLKGSDSTGRKFLAIDVGTRTKPFYVTVRFFSSVLSKLSAAIQERAIVSSANALLLAFPGFPVIIF